ncbi:arginase family protein [Conyzicola nivalis]|uniref:Arginase n=1 Tax=Conyzicola nivalis TaxID=1477021 RepID=A0A916SAY0_9MICO|nr:arginase family protein [Conyzicola nivalis]GGA91705.1 arginase [Conyzicola nivalis]
MPATFVVIPQWQGSGSSRALRLGDGAEAIRGDLPASSTRVVEVPLEAGDALGSGLARLGSLQLVRERSRAMLADVPDWALAIGGDCGIALAPIEHALDRTAGDLAVVWFDAHPDLNTLASSPSGAFSGMVLRTLLGEGVDGLVPAAPLAADRLVLAGVRSVDDGEDGYLTGSGIARLGVDELASADGLVAAVGATGAASVYLHIDLDVLDPAELDGVSDPVPFGLSAAALVQAIRAVKARHPIAGASIAGFSPASIDAAADDLPTILRIIGALTSP